MLAELNSTITIAEAARQAGFSANAMRYWIRRGQVDAINTPLGRLIVRESLEEFLRDRAERAIETTARL